MVKILHPVPPDVAPLSATAVGALVVNLACAFLLVRRRDHPGGLGKAAWLVARNDALANVGILAAGLVSLPLRSGWPDIVVGLAIGLLNLGAAREVWEAASDEDDEALDPRP